MENVKQWSFFQKISFVIFFIMPLAFLVVYWSGQGDAQTLTTTTVTDSTTTAPTICSYAYTDWSNCDSSGRQYRKVNSVTPSGCVGTPETSRSCTYQTTTTVPICVFSYSDWGVCQSSGIQYRRIIGQAPSGCSGGIKENLSRSCTYTPSATTTITTNPVICAYTYTVWSNCNSGGSQYRTVNSATPSGCVGNPETKRSCSYIPPTSATNPAPNLVNTNISEITQTSNCSYQCSPWSICSPAGIKSQSCRPSAADCPGEIKVNTQTCAPAICKFNYSDWGNCVDGWQFRNIKTVDPTNCVGGGPVLRQSCSSLTQSETVVPEQAENIPETAIFDPEISVNDEWKKTTFNTAACENRTCGGNADPDNDGLSNNDEYRYGTDPLNPDTDRDGKSDGEEVAKGSNPLKSSAKGEEDFITFENPKKSGTAKETIYQVTNVEMVDAPEGAAKQMKLTGKGPANSYVTVYVYSGQPVIVTVKTDSNGDWTYTVDNELEDGDHQVYVAVTNNSGAIKAKSAPLPFVKTAQAVTVAKAAGDSPVQSATKKGINMKILFFVVGVSFFGLALAVILIGLIIKKVAKKLN